MDQIRLKGDDGAAFAVHNSFQLLEAQRSILFCGEPAVPALNSLIDEFFRDCDLQPYTNVRNLKAPTQQSFLLRQEHFQSLMTFMETIVKNRVLEVSERTFHRPSTLMERLYALALRRLFVLQDVPLQHLSEKQWKDTHTFKRWMRSWKRRFTRAPS